MKTRSQRIRVLRSRLISSILKKPVLNEHKIQTTKARRIIKKQVIRKSTCCTLKKHSKSQCKLCKKPFGELESWKKLCLFCYWKIYGEIVKCSACKIEFLNPKKTGEEDHFCYSCKLATEGADKHKCKDCSKTFYQSKISKINKPFCYDCYLKRVGIKIQCKSCNKEIHVKKEDLEWKNK